MDCSCTPPRPGGPPLTLYKEASAGVSTSVSAAAAVMRCGRAASALPSQQPSSPSPSSILASSSEHERENSRYESARQQQQQQMTCHTRETNASTLYTTGGGKSVEKVSVGRGTGASTPVRLTQELVAALCYDTALDEAPLDTRARGKGKATLSGQRDGSRGRSAHRRDRVLDWLKDAPPRPDRDTPVEEGLGSLTREDDGSASHEAALLHTPSPPPNASPLENSPHNDLMADSAPMPAWCVSDVVTPVRQPPAPPSLDCDTSPLPLPPRPSPPRVPVQRPRASSSLSLQWNYHHGRSPRDGSGVLSREALAHTAPVHRRPPTLPQSQQQEQQERVWPSSMTLQPPRVSLGRPSPFSSFYTRVRTAPPPPPESSVLLASTPQRHSHVDEKTLVANTREGDEGVLGGFADTTLGGRAADTIALRICTLSGFTLRVVVDRRMPVARLADRVARYLHLHPAQVQLKYAKTGAVFNAADAPAENAETTTAEAQARLCDVPNLAEGDVLLVLLQPQAAHGAAATQHAKVSKLSSTSAAERAVSIRAGKRRLARSGEDAPSERYTGVADSAVASSSASSSSPHRARRRVSTLPLPETSEEDALVNSLHVHKKDHNVFVHASSRRSGSAARMGSGGNRSVVDDGAVKASAGNGDRAAVLFGTYGYPPLTRAPPAPPRPPQQHH